MSRRMALARILFGLLLVALLYGGAVRVRPGDRRRQAGRLPGRRQQPRRTSW